MKPYYSKRPVPQIMNVKNIPEHLLAAILPFNWNLKKVWALPCESQLYPRSDFDYLLSLAFWSSVQNQGMLYDISPLNVLMESEKAPHQYKRIMDANIEYPLDILNYQGQLWILDGLHRLAQLYLLDVKTVAVRVHPEHVIPWIKV